MSPWTLHWHGDTFDLPPGAELLASTADVPHQAFRYGRSLAVQFHPEADGARIEQWLVGHAAEITAHGLDPRSIRDDAKRNAVRAAHAGMAVLESYVDSI